MTTKQIPRWLPVGEHGAVLKDTAGLVYGSVTRHDQCTTLWLGTALTGPIVASVPVRGLRPGEKMGANLVSYPAEGGKCQYAPTKEKAMEFVTQVLTEHGKL